VNNPNDSRDYNSSWRNTGSKPAAPPNWNNNNNNNTTKFRKRYPQSGDPQQQQQQQGSSEIYPPQEYEDPVLSPEQQSNILSPEEPNSPPYKPDTSSPEQTGKNYEEKRTPPRQYRNNNNNNNNNNNKGRRGGRRGGREGRGGPFYEAKEAPKQQFDEPAQETVPPNPPQNADIPPQTEARVRSPYNKKGQSQVQYKETTETTEKKETITEQPPSTKPPDQPKNRGWETSSVSPVSPKSNSNPKPPAGGFGRGKPVQTRENKSNPRDKNPDPTHNPFKLLEEDDNI
jgi:hypothetical protein